MFISTYDLYSTLTEIYILFCINIVLIYGVLFSTNFVIGYPLLSKNIAYLCFQICLISILFFSFNSYTIVSWNQLMLHNFFTMAVKFILLVSFCFWICSSLFYIKHEKLNSFEYWILSLLSVVAMTFVVQACDLLSMYLAIEFQSLILYILTSFKRSSEFSTESGLKYFILGAFSSVLLLFGSSILYGLTGLTNFNDFSNFFLGSISTYSILNYGTILGFIIICVSLLFKISAAPFHIWTPDVYDGSPTTSTLFFSILPKLSIVFLSLRFCLLAFQDFFYVWQKIVIFSIYLSILIGTLSAFYQNKWKRFLAYSSINHVGFILLGFSVGELEGIFSMVFYLITYIILIFGTFLFLMSLRYYHFPVHYQIRYIQDLTSLAETSPALSLSLLLLLFSMAGIPPLLGFFSKTFVLLTSLQSGMYTLSIFSVIMSCAACFYYIRLIKLMYFDKTYNLLVTYPLSKLNAILLCTFTFFSSFFFLDLEIILFFSTRISLFFS